MVILSFFLLLLLLLIYLLYALLWRSVLYYIYACNYYMVGCFVDILARRWRRYVRNNYGLRPKVFRRQHLSKRSTNVLAAVDSNTRAAVARPAAVLPWL